MGINKLVNPGTIKRKVTGNERSKRNLNFFNTNTIFKFSLKHIAQYMFTQRITLTNGLINKDKSIFIRPVL